MAGEGFQDRLRAAEERANSLICVGLDPDHRLLPGVLDPGSDPAAAIVKFNRAIIDATSDLVSIYKPNFAFYLPYGPAGVDALLQTRRMIPSQIPVLLDCKVTDMGPTAEAYARAFFVEWGFDAITVSPYMGEDALAPYLAYEGHGVISICKTSNPGSGDFQDQQLAAGGTLYQQVAKRANDWSERYPATVGLVVGATYPDQLKTVRRLCPSLPVLLPGVGSQAGNVEDSVRAGIDDRGGNLMVSASRSIIYASDGPDFAEKAREAAITLREQVNVSRTTANITTNP